MKPDLRIHTIYKQPEVVKAFMAVESWNDLPDTTKDLLAKRFNYDAKSYAALQEILQRFEKIKKWDEHFTGTLFNYLGYEYCANPICKLSPSDYDCIFQCDTAKEEKLDVSGDYNIRRAFMAREGRTLVSIDYSQIELRVTANIANEKNWIDAFLAGVDVHTRTAMDIFKVDVPNKQQRRLSKTSNFCILYGGMAFRLSVQAGISIEEAQQVYEGWLAGVPAVALWIMRVIKQSKIDGYAETAFGRRRPLPGLYSDIWKIKSGAERQVANTVIQGCQRYNSRVLTNKGYIKIGDLCNGVYTADTVWDGEGWRTFTALNRGPAQAVDMKLSDGRTIECDDRHILFTQTMRKGITEKHISNVRVYEKGKGSRSIICALKTGQEFEFEREFEPFDHIGYVHNAKPITVNTPELLEECWYWAGYLTGDGCLTGADDRTDRRGGSHIMMVFGLHEHKANREIAYKSFLEKLGLHHYTREGTGKGKAHLVSVSSKGLIDMFEWLGLKYKATAKFKRVPERLFHETLRNRKAFTQGLWDSDGDIKTRALHMMNWGLLSDMQQIYDTIGIKGHLSAIYKDGSSLLGMRGARSGNRGTLYHPSFDGVCAHKIEYLGYEEDTYTLAVDHLNHRFFANGILHKNTSADLMKSSMIRVDSEIRKRKWDKDVKMLATIHDEILFEVKDEMLHIAIPVLRDTMTIHQAGWPVPLTVDVEVGKDWGATEGYIPPEDRDVVGEYPVHIMHNMLTQEEGLRLKSLIDNYKGDQMLGLQYDNITLRIKVSDPDEVIRVLSGQ